MHVHLALNPSHCFSAVTSLMYSRTSIARTSKYHLPRLIRTCFLSPYEIFPIAQANKYLEKFSYFIMNLYVVCTH